jgi:hypothetical protein
MTEEQLRKLILFSCTRCHKAFPFYFQGCHAWGHLQEDGSFIRCEAWKIWEFLDREGITL